MAGNGLIHLQHFNMNPPSRSIHSNDDPQRQTPFNDDARYSSILNYLKEPLPPHDNDDVDDNVIHPTRQSFIQSKDSYQ